MSRSYSKRIKEKYTNKKIIILLIIIAILFISILIYNLFDSTLFYNLFSKPKGTENITTKLTDDKDFLNWFIDFDKLYQKNIHNINYSLNKEMFEKINNYLEGNTKNNILYKDNTYYIDESNTLELDVYTRSLRYTKYDNNNKIEILEINLKNGKYYIQLINSKNIYKIILNNKLVKKDKTKNKGKVEVLNSIYNTLDFAW